jgi:hypothetical protein
MIMRRILMVCAALVCTAAASASVAWALPGGATTSTTAAHPSLARTAHLVRFFATGPSSSVGGGAASASAPAEVSFKLPTSASTYAATITLSFEYRTTGSITYYVEPGLSRGSGTQVHAHPVSRNLAPSLQRTSVTLEFRTALVSSATYTLQPIAIATAPNLDSGSITTSRLLVDVEAWPTS